jgi:hypothetical protein
MRQSMPSHIWTWSDSTATAVVPCQAAIARTWTTSRLTAAMMIARLMGVQSLLANPSASVGRIRKHKQMQFSFLTGAEAHLASWCQVAFAKEARKFGTNLCVTSAGLTGLLK